jgi:hypothetical protein
MPGPFKLGDEAFKSPSQRQPRTNAVPPNPLDERNPREWAPGIGQQSGQIVKERIPWPAAGPATPGGKPFKVG